MTEMNYNSSNPFELKQKKMLFLKHFFYWLRKYLTALFFPRLFMPNGFYRDWMTWKEYKRMTENFTQPLDIDP